MVSFKKQIKGAGSPQRSMTCMSTRTIHKRSTRSSKEAWHGLRQGNLIDYIERRISLNMNPSDILEAMAPAIPAPTPFRKVARKKVAKSTENIEPPTYWWLD